MPEPDEVVDKPEPEELLRCGCRDPIDELEVDLVVLFLELRPFFDLSPFFWLPFEFELLLSAKSVCRLLSSLAMEDDENKQDEDTSTLEEAPALPLSLELVLLNWFKLVLLFELR